jgi:hypothetical protein
MLHTVTNKTRPANQTQQPDISRSRKGKGREIVEEDNEGDEESELIDRNRIRDETPTPGIPTPLKNKGKGKTQTLPTVQEEDSSSKKKLQSERKKRELNRTNDGAVEADKSQAVKKKTQTALTKDSARKPRARLIKQLTGPVSDLNRNLLTLAQI